MRGKFILLFLLGLLVVPFVLAAGDVAYLYNKEKYIDYNVAGELYDQGMSVTFVKCTRKGEMNLSGYDLVVVGDEYLSCINRLNTDVPMIFTGARNARYMGLAKKYKAMRMTSNYPIEIMYDGVMQQVYTDSQYNKYVKTNIPIYLLAKLGDREGFNKMSTSFNGPGKEIGSSIVFVDEGSELFNGDVTNRNICFFGIAKSDYWTDNALEMFRDCVDFVMQKVHDVALTEVTDGVNGIKIVDSEGGIVEDGEVMFSGEDYQVYFNVLNKGAYWENVSFEAFSCVNWTPIKKDNLQPETSSLKHNTVNFSCMPGDYQIMINAMIDYDVDVSDNMVTRDIVIVNKEDYEEYAHDVMLDDFKVSDSEGTLIEDGMLTKGESYKILVDLTNVGDFTEDVTFDGKIKNSTGDVVDTFTHMAVNDLLAGVKKDDKAKTVLFNLDVGVYDIVVEAIVDVDDVPSNNVVLMSVEVV